MNLVVLLFTFGVTGLLAESERLPCKELYAMSLRVMSLSPPMPEIDPCYPAEERGYLAYATRAKEKHLMLMNNESVPIFEVCPDLEDARQEAMAKDNCSSATPFPYIPYEGFNEEEVETRLSLFSDLVKASLSYQKANITLNYENDQKIDEKIAEMHDWLNEILNNLNKILKRMKEEKVLGLEDKKLATNMLRAMRMGMLFLCAILYP